MKTTNRQPVLFIGHGSPMNAIEDNKFTRFLSHLGPQLRRYKPEVILVISAHWQTEGTQVTAMAKPKTIHDFYGFPRELHEMIYPASGSLEKAQIVQNVLGQSTSVKLDESWGLDHGSWSLLVHLFPEADIPVLQLSLDVRKANENHVELGKKLSTLRDQGFLIIGSGDVVHNLRMMNWKDKDLQFDWAYAFEQSLKKALVNQTEDFLTSEYQNHEAYKLSVPTEEHYLPLLYAYGASAEEDVSFIYEGMEYGSISMLSLAFGFDENFKQ